MILSQEGFLRTSYCNQAESRNIYIASFYDKKLTSKYLQWYYHCLYIYGIY